MTDPHLDQPNQDETPDWLDTLLRDTRPSPLVDNGFSQRVMRKIPPSAVLLQPRQVPPLKPWQAWRFERYTLIGLAVGSAIAAASLPGLDEIGRALLAMTSIRQLGSTTLAPLLACMASAAVLAYSMLDAER